MSDRKSRWDIAIHLLLAGIETVEGMFRLFAFCRYRPLGRIKWFAAQSAAPTEPLEPL
jgi:hypothetical protein